jgi:hypothetical protein
MDEARRVASNIAKLHPWPKGDIVLATSGQIGRALLMT